ncbi:hypothetical protein ACTMTJ_38925 [Phytohabitans sp. LJ34]|uniref:hypothetical protein n=1 Tax=Phytohabitans sp. LJ34 TaxID=3452217 RepID=UPI003F8C590E
MLHELLAEIASQRGYDSADGPEPVVSLEMFFDGNNDIGSIGCNLTEHPGPERFYAILRTIRDRADVLDVWVGISEVMDDNEWPFSDHVYVVTTAAASEVAAWARELQPEEPTTEWWTGKPPAHPIHIPAGARLITLWWD